jgi:hypothetical protein
LNGMWAKCQKRLITTTVITVSLLWISHVGRIILFFFVVKFLRWSYHFTFEANFVIVFRFVLLIEFNLDHFGYGFTDLNWGWLRPRFIRHYLGL